MVVKNTRIEFNSKTFSSNILEPVFSNQGRPGPGPRAPDGDAEHPTETGDFDRIPRFDTGVAPMLIESFSLRTFFSPKNKYRQKKFRLQF